MDYPLVTAPPEDASAQPDASSAPEYYKLGVLDPATGKMVPHVYPHCWVRQPTNGPDRLVIAAAGNPVDLLIGMVRCLPRPYSLLYVLLVSRVATHPVGRYQSEIIQNPESVEEFLRDYRRFLEGDARHTIWIISASPDQPKLVYDQHGIIYAYGPLDDYIDSLRISGLHEESEMIATPQPHVHIYHPEFDAVEESLLKRVPWMPFPIVESVDLR